MCTDAALQARPGAEVLSDRVDIGGEALDRLGDGCAVVFDDVVAPPILDDWRDRARARDRAGGLSPAGVGSHGVRDPTIRDDRTCFLDDGDPMWEAPVAWFGALGETLEQGLRLALPAFSLQLAVFPPGAGYVRHVDTIRSDPRRRITATLYLERGWGPDDAGELRVVEPTGERDLLPIGGRLVLFRSDRVPHEVRPTRRLRYALTAWFGSEGRIRRR